MCEKNLLDVDKSVDLDEVLDKFSLFGRYHAVAMVLLLFANVSNAVNGVNYVFTVEKVMYSCNSTDIRINSSVTNSSDTNTSELSVCTEWIYENPHSFVAEFDLAGQEWKRTLVGTVHSFGYMVGLLLVGPMSDRLGRQRTVVITGVVGAVMGLARSFSPWYWLYIALEFLESAVGDICSPAFMLGVEMVSTKKRVPFTMISTFGFAIGGAVLALMAWLFPYFRTLLLVLYGPALFFFFYTFLLDESPRWQLTKGKKDKVKKTLMRAAAKNKIEIKEEMLDKLRHEKSEEVKFFSSLLRSTFQSTVLLKRFLVCVVWWTTSTFVNYGMTINTVSLQGNKYVNFALISLIDIPGTIILIFVLKYFKRKTSLMCCFLLGAVLCLIQPFVPTSANFGWVSVFLYMIGKLLSSVYFSITYIYTSELFPTYTRNSMHALCSSLGRIGHIVAPQTPLLMSYWAGLPALVFGGMALIAGLLTFLVPDTADASLPDTVHQAEALGNKTVAVICDENIPLQIETQT